MAATILIGLGANLALQNNAGRSALRLAEQCVAQDAANEDEDEEEDEDEDAKRERLAARAKLHKQHRFLVATLKAHGAA